MTTHTIGKADKYYTLWLVSEYSERHDLYTSYGTNYQYLQNLSYDYESAVEKVKQLTESFDVDLDLRGRRSFKKALKREYHTGVFLFGRYRGREFHSVVEDDDWGWVLWYWRSTQGTDKEDSTLTEFLIQKGLLFELSDGTILDESELTRHIKSVFSKEVYKLGHFNIQGDRVRMDLKVRSEWGYDTRFGWVTVIEFIDVMTNQLYYIRGSYQTLVDFKEGDTVEVEGTISHKEWYDTTLRMNRKETQLKRPKIISNFS